MMTMLKSAFLRAYRDESGQTLPFMVLCIILFLGMAGLTIDVGHAYVAYRELQTSTDAAALAAGYEMATSTATVTSIQNAATGYSSATVGTIVGVNTNSSLLPSVGITTTPECLSSVTWVACGATVAGKYNAVRVVQTMTAPTFFMKALNAFGVKSAGSIPLSTVAVASMRGAANTQYNVALVIDTTNSMKSPDTDGNCSGSQLLCAEQGAEVLLNSLTPCNQGSTSGSCNGAFDTVALFTFPNVSYNTVAGDYTCTATTPTIDPYSTPSSTGTSYTFTSGSTAPTYNVTFGATSANSAGYVDDYSLTNGYNGGVATSSPLGIALGLDTSQGTRTKPCTGLQAPGGEGTYLAGAVYAAMGSLIAAQVANPGSQNAMIILTDGNAPGGSFGGQHNFTNASGGSETLNDTAGSLLGTYPSMYDLCEQAVTAANHATSLGITVYTVAYNSPTSGGCISDVYATTIKSNGANPAGTNIQPCTELRQMASTAADFYSDATLLDGGACTSSANPNLTLDQVFTNIPLNFTRARLIPAS